MSKKTIAKFFSNEVASLIVFPDGTPITKPSNFCRLCKDIIRKSEKGCSNCKNSDKIIGSYNPSGPIVQHCLSGKLFDAGASITVGGKHLASWLIGQIREEEVDEQYLIEYADKIGVERTEFLKAYKEVPIMSLEKFEKFVSFVFIIGETGV
jgi:ligand-binding sensor protein